MFRVVQLLIFSVLLSFTSGTLNAASWAEIEGKSRKIKGFMPYYISISQGRVWLEVSRLDSPFIMYTGLPMGVGSNDIGLDRGQLGESRLVQFERYGDKIFLKQLNTYYRADSDNTAEQNSVKEAFASSVLHGFKIEARLGNKFLIELTPFLLQDLHGVSQRLELTQQGSYSVDANRSALNTEKIKNFPKNTLFESVLTFKGNNPGNYVKQVTPAPKSLTVHQHLSFVELPDDGYQPRVFHPKSGMFDLTYADYATPIDKPLEKKLIYRHRIVKDQEGKIKPIIYYLDPGAPEPVKTALLEGARWWGEAFEAIGLPNAYQVEVLPEGADPLDVRYNVIQWVHRATRGWSYGFSVSDPRTGEILKGHVTLGSLRVRQDLLIANALTGIYGAQDNSDAAMNMALDRIRQLSAHEVGHTLGLSHNFAASPSSRASVMDYPHPLIRLKGGEISLEDAYAKGIGKWDIEAIRYAYSEFESPEKEAEGLRQIVRNSSAQGLSFISDPDARSAGGAHPDAHLWDNNLDPAAELDRVMEVRQVALQKFGHDSLQDGVPYSELSETLVPLYLFHRYQVEAAVKLIGGVNYEYSVKGDSFRPIKFIEAERQEEALEALLKTLSTEQLLLPEAVIKLIPPKAYGYSKSRESFPSYTGLTLDPVSMAEVASQHTLNVLLNPERLTRVLQQQNENAEQLTFESIINELMSATLRSPEQQGIASLVQQRVDYLTVLQLLRVASKEQVSPEVRAHLHSEIGKLNGWLVTQSKRNPVRFLWLKDLVDKYLSGDLKLEQNEPLAMPPGSPIG